MRAALVVYALAFGCASRAEAHRFESDGVSVVFPAEPDTHRGHEGPLAQSHLARAVFDGCVHEAAIFTLPRPLDGAERARLLDEVERGLGARPDVREERAHPLELFGMAARELDIALEGDRRGRWQLFYPSADRMVQLSVVGPREACDAGAFFASFRAR